MNFLAGVNRLLRIEHILSGQDDDITSFSDTQHAADISLAQIAIQDEITELISERLIPYEHTTSTISLVTSTRSYALQTNFTRFFGVPSFYDSVSNIRIYEFNGGEEALMNYDLNYKTNLGAPMYWYWDNTTTKNVAFYNVPDSTWNARSLAYDYEMSVMVANSTDTIPFHNNEEAYSFIFCAARRFSFMRSKKNANNLMTDGGYLNAKSRLYAMIRPTNPPEYYGAIY
jgi:hypothetical protein